RRWPPWSSPTTPSARRPSGRSSRRRARERNGDGFHRPERLVAPRLRARRDAVMTRRRALSMLVGLALGLGFGVRRSSSGLPEDDIEILDEPSASEKIDLGRPFGTPVCASGRSGKTLLEALLP